MSNDLKTTEAQRKAVKNWTEKNKERKKELDKQHHQRRKERIKREHQIILNIKSYIENELNHRPILISQEEIIDRINEILNKGE